MVVRGVAGAWNGAGEPLRNGAATKNATRSRFVTPVIRVLQRQLG